MPNGSRRLDAHDRGLAPPGAARPQPQAGVGRPARAGTAAQLARDLLIAGVTACYSVEAIRRDGEPQEYTYPVVCDWIGHGLGFRKGRTSLLVGALGNDLLATLDDVFARTEDDAVCLNLSERTRQASRRRDCAGAQQLPVHISHAGAARALDASPQRATVADHVGEHASPGAPPSRTSRVARKAIESGRMQPVLGRGQLPWSSAAAHQLPRPELCAKPARRGQAAAQAALVASIQFLKQEAGRLRYHQLNLGIAQALDEHWGFYLPYDLDWRGRVYSISHFAYAPGRRDPGPIRIRGRRCC